MTLYEKALKIAAQAHKDQKRKHDGSPYIVHPVMVARILEQHGFGEEVVAAGLVHDVLEDSDISVEHLRRELGEEVVGVVTAVSENIELPWEERKQQYVANVAASSEAIWAVSVADKIHNAQNLIAHAHLVGSSVWDNFNRGKEKKIWFEELVCAKLSEVWQHPMLGVYRELIEEMKELPG